MTPEFLHVKLKAKKVEKKDGGKDKDKKGGSKGDDKKGDSKGDKEPIKDTMKKKQDTKPAKEEPK